MRIKSLKTILNDKLYYIKNKEKISKRCHEYYLNNKDIFIKRASINKDKITKYQKDYHKKYYLKYKNCIIEKSKEYRELNKEEIRKYFIEKLYGTTIEYYNELFELQEGCCAVCGKHQSELKKALGVDHDHTTGEIRSLLCVNCNIGLGHFKDDSILLEKAINYINKYKKIL